MCEPFTCTVYNGSAKSVAFSPDGQTLICGSQDETIKVWDVLTGECLKTLRRRNPSLRKTAPKRTYATGFTVALRNHPS
ncbi:hypothetical protein [Nostoc sp. UCD120]|uniref:WD40 repeat domain-containing protein n=1 Tax=unclassified Nostoc TaxID=2593658 RepID=UPI002892CF03|nr:hypothetical protein [Nostoc sp. UCD120]